MAAFTMGRHFSEMFYGFSYIGFFALWALSVLGFAGIYFTLSYIPGHAPAGLDTLPLWHRIGDSIYYSVITATNTGYGDIVPHGLSKVFAASEAFVGLFLFAIFIGKLISLKQNVAIGHMHRISFESTFHDIREDLHIVRRDCNKLMDFVRAGTEMTPRRWQSLRVAYMQISGLLREVSIFYDAEDHLYHIDVRRERLLVEAFHRTLEKLVTMFSLFDEYKIDWIAQEKTINELHDLLDAFDDSLSQWKREAEHTSGKLFEDLLAIVNHIRARLAEVHPPRPELAVASKKSGRKHFWTWGDDDSG